MRPLRVRLAAFFTLVATLTISDVPLIQNPLRLFPFIKDGKVQSSQVLAQTPDAHNFASFEAELGDNDADKVTIFEPQVRSYRLLLKTLLERNRTEAALEFAQRGRARGFVALLASQFPSNAKTQELATRQQTTAPPTIEQIKQIAREHQATLVEYSINYDNFQVPGKQQTQESELFIWVVQPTGEVDLRRVDLKPLWQKQNSSLSNLIISTRESIGLGRGGTGSKVEKGQTKAPQIFVAPKAHVEIVPLQVRQTQQQTKGLQQLHQLLIQPIADLLPKDPNARVIFIPQGELFLVPFAALQDTSGKYLIEQHSILTAPSIQVLDFTRQQRQRLGSGESGVGSREFLVVGNPRACLQSPNLSVGALAKRGVSLAFGRYFIGYTQGFLSECFALQRFADRPYMPSVAPRIGEPPQQLSNLPGAEQEAKEIAQLLNTQAITGNEATKVAILQKMAGARIIHLATQSIVDEVRGVGSAIALAPSGNDNGLLTAEEILNLKLNAELVVLSGCDTGLGKITGDGVIGLSRSFIAAGVPSVVVSLGDVPDDTTAFLMREFYQNLSSTPDKAQALRNAMLTTMKQHPDPKDWAAFTLIGEAQ